MCLVHDGNYHNGFSSIFGCFRMYGNVGRQQNHTRYTENLMSNLKFARRMKIVKKLDGHDGCVNALNFNQAGIRFSFISFRMWIPEKLDVLCDNVIFQLVWYNLNTGSGVVMCSLLTHFVSSHQNITTHLSACISYSISCSITWNCNRSWLNDKCKAVMIIYHLRAL